MKVVREAGARLRPEMTEARCLEPLVMVNSRTEGKQLGMGIIMARMGVGDMYLVLLLTARFLHKVKIERGKGKRMVAVTGEVKMVDKMVWSMETELIILNKAKARGAMVKARPEVISKVIEGSDSSPNRTMWAKEHHLCSFRRLLVFLS